MFPVQKGLGLLRPVAAAVALNSRGISRGVSRGVDQLSAKLLPGFARQFVGPLGQIGPCWVTTGIKPRLYVMDLMFPQSRSFSTMAGKRTHITKKVEEERVTILFSSVLEKGDDSVKFLTISSERFHNELRARGHCEIREERPIKDILKPGDEIVSVIDFSGRGPYFGGAPTSSLPEPLKEQIFPDLALPFTAAGLKEWKAIGESVDHGPRLSCKDEIVLVRRKDGSHYQVVIDRNAFVNSSVHFGVQTDHAGNTHPQINFTPGAGLYHFTKLKLHELPNGEFIQTFSACTSASANVLTHWLCNLVETMSKSVSGISKELDEKGVFQRRTVGKGTGESFKALGTMLTGSPFLISTVAVHYDKDGRVLNMVLVSKSKAWPSAENYLEIKPSQHGIEKEKKICMYDIHIPQAGTMGDFTVAKLLTLKLNRSIVAYGIDEKGEAKPLDRDSEVYQLMMKQIEDTEFTTKELYENGASLGIRLSHSNRDPRAHSSLVTIGEEITPEQLKKHLESLIWQDPESMEHYFCGLCVKHAVQALRKVYEENPAGWEKNSSLNKLYKFLIGKTPSYANLMEGLELHGETINRVMQNSPEDAALMNQYKEWAKMANTEALIQKDQRWDPVGPIYS